MWGTGILAFAIPFALLFWGERTISAGLAGILNGTVPMWVFILGFVFTPGVEPFSWRKIAGLVLGIFGVVAVFYPKAFGADPSFLGTLAVTAMAVSYATSVLANRSLVAGFAGLLLLSFTFEGVPRPAEWVPVSTVVFTELYLGVVSTSVAFLLFYRLIGAWGSVRAATVTYVIPIAALGFDFALNASVPAMNESLGVAAITAGVVILNMRRK